MMKEIEPSRVLAVLLMVLAVSACDCAAIGSARSGLEVLSFELESAQPPADPRGGQWVVVPEADITLAWTLEERPERVVLAVDDEVLGSWSGANAPSRYEDLCTASRCTTAEPGEVLYTLTAIFSEEDEVIDSLSLGVTISPSGLQILSFRVSPQGAARGRDAHLSWETSGATAGAIHATPVDGGPSRLVATLDAEATHRGELQEWVEEATRFELVATGRDGRDTMATATVGLEEEAYFTEVWVTPEEVHPGGLATIHWEAVGLERLSILRDDGASPVLGIAGAEALAGSREVTVREPVRFLLVGTSLQGEPVDQICDGTGCGQAAVFVGIRPRAKVGAFWADPPSINVGDSTILRYDVANAEELRLLWDDGEDQWEKTLDLGENEALVTPAINTQYTLYALSGGAVTSTALASVEVKPRASIEVEIDQGIGGVWAGAQTWVRWQTQGAQSVQLDIGGRPVDLEGLDPAAGEVLVRFPDLADGTEVQVVLTAFGPHSLNTVAQTVVVRNL